MAITLPPELAEQWGITGQPRDKLTEYEVLRSFCVGLGVDVKKGEKVTLPARRAAAWVATGKLRKLGPKAEPAPAPEDEGDEDRAAEQLSNGDPDLTHQDPAVRGKRGSRKR